MDLYSAARALSALALISFLEAADAGAAMSAAAKTDKTAIPIKQRITTAIGSGEETVIFMGIAFFLR
jgi:hypothetical protein